ncbi:hypothetical protein K439DRAFT_1073650 [Ramaria rubella]|nr:hypothetical protein K439DRAFT_1073650 [Ramaria rubella]
MLGYISPFPSGFIPNPSREGTWRSLEPPLGKAATPSTIASTTSSLLREDSPTSASTLTFSEILVYFAATPKLHKGKDVALLSRLGMGHFDHNHLSSRNFTPPGTPTFEASNYRVTDLEAIKDAALTSRWGEVFTSNPRKIFTYNPTSLFSIP